ncbi:MAG: signal peptidase I [Bacilli bacterium]|nr:signal peptidase I [Bacilli bacterium]
MLKKLKNIYQTFIICLTFVLFALTIYILIAGVNAAKNNEMMSIFGYTYSVVPTDSMEPEINVGDSVIGKKESYDNLDIGDDVIYHYVYEDIDIYVVHRIIRYDEGYGFKTQGINTNQEDPIYVTKDNYVSTVVWSGSLANIGEIVLKNRGTLFLVLIAILLLIAGNGVFDIIKILDERKQLHQQEEKEQLEQNYEDELRRQVEAEIKKEQEENGHK